MTSRRNLIIAFAAAALVSLSACTVLPVREQQPNLPASFSMPGSNPLPDKWWQSLSDPVLNSLIEQALAGNFSLQSTWNRLDQAAAVAKQAGAALSPTLDVNAGVSRNWSDDSTTPSFNTGTFDTWSAGLSAGYEIDLWGRIRSSQEAAELDLRASAAQLRAAAVTLSAQVATTWYQLVEQYGQLSLLQQQLETNTKTLELLTIRFRNGTASATDVLQQRQLVESRVGDIANTESRIGVLEHQLAVLLGNTPDVPISTGPGLLIALPPLPATGLPAGLLQRRPDVQQAWLNVAAADRRVATALADRYPRISLSATATSSGQQPRDVFDSWLSNLAANLLLPVIDGGRRQAEVERTQAVARQAMSDYRQRVLDALAEVENALLREDRQRALLDSLNRQSVLSKQVIERVTDSYLNGGVDYLRVLDALLTDQSLERSQLQARRQLIENRIELSRTLAGGWALTRPPESADVRMQ